MGLTLSINKKFSLEGLGDGWGQDCFIRVKSADVSTMRSYKDAGLEKLSGLDAVEKEIEIMTPIVLGGAVMSTQEDGSIERVEFGREDAKDVLSMLPGTVIDELFVFMLGLGSLSGLKN